MAAISSAEPRMIAALVWVFRELARLIFRVVVASAVAAIIACLLALFSSGDLVRDMRIMFFLVGALLIMLAGAGNRSSATSHVINWGDILPGRGGILFHGFEPRPDQPTLTPGAVFVASGAVLIALGFAV